MSGSWPIQPCQSLRHSPLASTRTTAPPAGGAARGADHKGVRRTRRRSGARTTPPCHRPPGHDRVTTRQSAGQPRHLVSAQWGVEDGSAPTEPADTEPSARSTRPSRLAPAPGSSGNPAPAREPDALPTLEEVARRAGVGRGTVSAGRQRLAAGLRAQARAAVQEAIDELGYVPNRAARSLVTRRTDTVALVVSEPERPGLRRALLRRRRPRGQRRDSAASPSSCCSTMADTGTTASAVSAYLTEQHVDGVLLLSLHARRPARPLDARGACPPCAAVAGRRRRPSVRSSTSTTSAGGRAAVAHLLGRTPADRH